MRALRDIGGGVIRWVVGVVLGGAFFFLGYAPERWVAELIGSPPSWVLDPRMKLLFVLGGMLVIGCLSLLKKAGTPRIVIRPVDRADGMHFAETALKIEPSLRGPHSKWAQVVILGNGADLIGCETRLVSVQRLNDDGTEEKILSQPLLCIWDLAPQPSATRMDIPEGIPQRANIFASYDGRPELEMWVVSPPETLQDKCRKKEDIG
jgi:hypothetical protein